MARRWRLREVGPKRRREEVIHHLSSLPPTHVHVRQVANRCEVVLLGQCSHCTCPVFMRSPSTNPYNVVPQLHTCTGSESKRTGVIEMGKRRERGNGCTHLLPSVIIPQIFTAFTCALTEA